MLIAILIAVIALIGSGLLIYAGRKSVDSALRKTLTDASSYEGERE